MAHEFSRIYRIEFADTDMAGIVHFANFFRFMEATEHAFFRSLGHSVHVPTESGQVGWPRVHASCDYKSPLRFEDEVEIKLIVREMKNRSIKYDFIFQKLDRTEIATGSLTVVCTEIDRETGKMKAMPIPICIAEQIEAAPMKRL